MKESLFFIAILPPPPLSDKVTDLKKVVFDQFGSKAAMNAPPHITLHMPFKWKESKLPKLLEALDSFTFNSFPFDIELNGFNFFPPRVVFIEVQDNPQLIDLQRSLTKHIRSRLQIVNANYKDRAFHPHITIAFRDLKKSVFPMAQDYFSSMDFNGKFEVNEICLLKHTGKVWEHFKTF